MKNAVSLRPTYWASVSGGKDSLYMLKLIFEHPETYPLDGVVHFEVVKSKYARKIDEIRKAYELEKIMGGV